MTDVKNTVDIVEQGVVGEDVLAYLPQVTLKDAPGAKSTFLRIRETLTRIGIQKRRDQKELIQTCHILCNQGRFYIVHFKHLFALDGKPCSLDRGDIARMNRIVALLVEWGMIELVNPGQVAEPVCSMRTIKIVPAAQRGEWTLTPKHSLGRNKKEV